MYKKKVVHILRGTSLLALCGKNCEVGSNLLGDPIERIMVLPIRHWERLCKGCMNTNKYVILRLKMLD